MTTPPDVRTRAEAADRLGVSVVTVTRWAEDGRLPFVRRDPWMFATPDLDALAGELAEEYEAKARALRAGAPIPAEGIPA
jgi:transcriptional regulator with XRE-family HTH domain